jgi:cyanate lyase
MADRPENTGALIDKLVERSVEQAVFGKRRGRSNELWGDGILSAIDCKVTLEKRGERGVITIDAKFLHYKEF